MTARVKKRDYYTNKLSQLEEELAAVESDWKDAPGERERLKLDRAAAKIIEEIEKIEDKLSELDAKDSAKNVRENQLEKILQKINFTEAKKTADRLKDKLGRDGGAVLLFLQKSKKQMGNYCVEEVINVIMGDQVVDGEIAGAYQRYPVDVGSAISQYNENEFLVRLASHFGIQESTDNVELSRELRVKIRDSLDSGTTIFLEIKSFDDLLEQEAFMKWFVEQFWQPLIDEIAQVSKKYKSKFIVALIADSQVLSDCSAHYFCDGEPFDCYKLIELPLPDWTFDDIHTWLVRFKNLSASMKGKTNPELERIAKKIHRESEGTPQSICVSLREQFL